MKVTLKQINAAIADLGYELVRGKGYFYFWPLTDDKPQLYDDSVFTPRLASMPVEEWRAELVHKLSDYRNQ